MRWSAETETVLRSEQVPCGGAGTRPPPIGDIQTLAAPSITDQRGDVTVVVGDGGEGAGCVRLTCECEQLK